MYDARVITKIRKLLKQGFKQRWIAKQVGCSQWTVHRVAAGKIASYRLEDDNGRAIRPKKLGKCPRHGKIRVPCTICAAEKYRREHPEIDWSASDPPPNDDERLRRLTLVQWTIVNRAEFKITQGYE